jgi:hypothetical protein
MRSDSRPGWAPGLDSFELPCNFRLLVCSLRLNEFSKSMPYAVGIQRVRPGGLPNQRLPIRIGSERTLVRDRRPDQQHDRIWARGSLNHIATVENVSAPPTAIRATARHARVYAADRVVIRRRVKRFSIHHPRSASAWGLA